MIFWLTVMNALSTAPPWNTCKTQRGCENKHWCLLVDTSYESSFLNNHHVHYQSPVSPNQRVISWLPHFWNLSHSHHKTYHVLRIQACNAINHTYIAYNNKQTSVKWFCKLDAFQKKKKKTTLIQYPWCIYTPSRRSYDLPWQKSLNWLVRFRLAESTSNLLYI